MKNLNMNQQNVKILSKMKVSFTVVLIMLLTFLCTNTAMAQTWSGQGNGDPLDRWTINDDNSNHWSQLRLQVGNVHGWNMLNEGILKWSYDASGNHSNLGYRKMSLTTDGKLGIGDFDPLINLAIGDSDTGFNQNGDGELGFYTNNVERVRVDKDGKVGISTNNPSNNLHIKGISNQSNPVIFLEPSTWTSSGHYGELRFGDTNHYIRGEHSIGMTFYDTNCLIFNTGGSNQMTFSNNGKLSIGTTNMPNTVGGADVSAYKLYVKGGVLTEEVRVRTGWADYVFADDYKLLPIEEVESFIKENNHLPNVPSAKTVEEEGLELGDITRIQQEKIEELMLYIIEQQKQIDALKQSVNNLMRRTKNSTKK